MNKNVKTYERMLKQKIEARTGTAFDEWLEPQLHAAALCWQMLEKVHEELMKGALVTQKLGSKDQWYSEVNPLMPTYKELQRTIVLHYEALGLNFKSKPANIKEPVRSGGEEHDKLAAALKEIQGI